MAGCKSTLTGEDFYGPYDAQDNAKAHAAELGMDTVPSLNITYTEAGLCRAGVYELQSTQSIMRMQLRSAIACACIGIHPLLWHQ